MSVLKFTILDFKIIVARTHLYLTPHIGKKSENRGLDYVARLAVSRRVLSQELLFYKLLYSKKMKTILSGARCVA